MRPQRIHIEPGDIRPHHAAQRLGLSEDAFKLALPDLLARGFPSADETTGNFDLQAIDEWRKQRHARLFWPDQSIPNAVISDRIRRVFGNG
jgi:hypothetical protein